MLQSKQWIAESTNMISHNDFTLHLIDTCTLGTLESHRRISFIGTCRCLGGTHLASS